MSSGSFKAPWDKMSHSTSFESSHYWYWKHWMAAPLISTTLSWNLPIYTSSTTISCEYSCNCGDNKIVSVSKMTLLTQKNEKYNQHFPALQKKSVAALFNCTMTFWVAKLVTKSPKLSNFRISAFYNHHFGSYRKRSLQQFKLGHFLLSNKITDKI